MIISLGMAAVIQNNTLIDWWVPASVCAVVAIPCGILLKGVVRWITHFVRPMWNIIAGCVLSFAVFLGSFYALNYYMADEASSQEYRVPVLDKFTEEHYHVQRVSRYRVRRGQKYQVYYVYVELPDSSGKKIEVPVSEYVKIKKGRRITLRMERGLFGITVIKNLKFPVRQYKTRR